MNIEPIHLLYGALFLSVLFLVEGLYLLVAGRPQAQRAVNRRQRLLANGTNREEALALLLRRGARDGLSATLVRLRPLQFLEGLLMQSGIGLPTGHLLAIMAGLSGGVFSMSAALYKLPVAAAFLLGPVVGIGLPVLVLRIARSRRTARFGEQLPDALDTIVRSLRAGHPVATALRLVSEQMSDPIGSEFGIVVDEMTYGLELREALERLAQRVGYPELGLMTVAIKVQHQSGGNLAEVLAGLSRVIRARHQMIRKIASLSAEGRMSAVVMMIIPFAVAGGIKLMNPGYFAAVQNDPLFLAGMGVAAASLLLGMATIWRMVNVKV